MNESSLTKVHRRRLLKQVNPCIPTNVTPRLRLLTRTARTERAPPSPDLLPEELLGRDIPSRFDDEFTPDPGSHHPRFLHEMARVCDAGARKLAKVNLNQ